MTRFDYWIADDIGLLNRPNMGVQIVVADKQRDKVVVRMTRQQAQALVEGLEEILERGPQRSNVVMPV